MGLPLQLRCVSKNDGSRIAKKPEKCRAAFSQWDSKGMHPFGGGAAPPKKRKLLGGWFGGSASKKK
jgi:hypothetical protein